MPADRSFPNRRGDLSVSGVYIDAEGPSHLRNVSFLNFKKNEIRHEAAIEWHAKYKFHNGISTSSSGLKFNFPPSDAPHMYKR